MMGGHKPEHADAPPQVQQEKTFDPLHFVAPTEFVDLPSQGKGYPETHPLHGKGEVEIRYMTAKDEDILSSQTLLKKGVALERFMQNILVDRRINSKKLFVADRNAILIAARVSGYGNIYQTNVTCPSCGNSSDTEFNLNDKKVVYLNLNKELGIEETGAGTFTTKMPYSKFKIEFKLLLGEDEIYIANVSSTKRRKKMVESMLSDQYKRMIVSIEGHRDRLIIDKYVDAMPTIDSRHLRACYKSTAPDVKISEEFNCHSCGHDQEMEVPFGADFFWPDR
jgi:transcription elongation factor Elf1